MLQTALGKRLPVAHKPTISPAARTPMQPCMKSSTSPAETPSLQSRRRVRAWRIPAYRRKLFEKPGRLAAHRSRNTSMWSPPSWRAMRMPLHRRCGTIFQQAAKSLPISSCPMTCAKSLTMVRQPPKKDGAPVHGVMRRIGGCLVRCTGAVRSAST